MASGAVKLTRAKIIHLNSYERALTIVHSADSTVPCFSQRREGGGLKIMFKVVTYCAYCLHMVLLLHNPMPSTIQGDFFHWYPPKKLKYGKPRLGESTLT